MRKNYLPMLVAVIGIAGSGFAAKAARAQAVDQVVANVPYQFVVDGKTFPAGSYRVSRVSDLDDRELLLRNVDTNESALIDPTVVESNATNQSNLSFEHVGGEYLLNKIETADHIFTIAVPRSEIMLAQAKGPNGTTGSGSASGSH